MKKTSIKILKQSVLLPAVLFACLAVSAQRGDRNGRGGEQNRTFSRQGNGAQQRSGGFSQQRNADRVSPQRSMQSRERTINSIPNRSFSDRSNRPDIQSSRESRSFSNPSIDRNRNSRNITRNVPDQRDRISRPDYNRSRNVTVNRNNNRSYDYNINRGRSYSYGRSGYSSPFRYTYSYPYYGQRYTRLNFNYHVIPYGGIGYCYNAGIFYRPFGSYYQVVAPPIGISINILPFGYSSFYLGGIPYYFYGNTYYRRYNDYYQVVDPPLGAKLPALPRGAEEVFINGQRYFEDNGTYYMEEYNINNQRLYTVVGVHGMLDQEQVDRIINGTSSVIMENGVGEVYNELPYNSSKVNINGQDYYRSPDDVYYLEISDGKNIAYQVVSSK